MRRRRRRGRKQKKIEILTETDAHHSWVSRSTAHHLLMLRMVSVIGDRPFRLRVVPLVKLFNAVYPANCYWFREELRARWIRTFENKILFRPRPKLGKVISN